MARLLRKLPVHALVVGILLGMTATIAFSLTSPLKAIGCYLGYCYENQAGIYGSADEYLFSGDATVYADNEVPQGYMGVWPRVYRNGVLCADNGSYSYNDSSLYGYGIGIYANCGTGDYQTQGLTRVYTGDGSTGYSSDITYWTPIIHKN